MGRRIVTKRLEGIAPGVKSASIDGYFDRVIKYIPSDVVAAWTAVTGLVNTDAQAPQNTLLWILFGVFTLLTAGWTWKQTTNGGRLSPTIQILLATVSFMVWVFALGGPFTSLEGFYRPLLTWQLLSMHQQMLKTPYLLDKSAFRLHSLLLPG